MATGNVLYQGRIEFESSYETMIFWKNVSCSILVTSRKKGCLPAWATAEINRFGHIERLVFLDHADNFV